MEADIFRAPHIDAAVHGTEEEIGLVSEADFGIGVFHR